MLYWILVGAENMCINDGAVRAFVSVFVVFLCSFAPTSTQSDRLLLMGKCMFKVLLAV